MKQYLQMAILVGSCLFILPLLVLYINDIPLDGKQNMETSEMTLELQKEKDDIMEEETLIGILAKEIPYTYEIEALKAQAIVERTYMARRILGIQTKGAIVGYTVDELHELWKEDYDKIYSIYQKAVRETKGKMILYQNQPIEAIYHRASSGKTRDAKEVYGVDVPYLKGVDSSVDVISTQISYSKKEVKERIQRQYEALAVDTETIKEQIQIVDKDEAGYIKMIQVGNVTLKGEEFKSLLELPSCAFKIYESEDKLIFDVKGRGNGVGLSQNGANELAMQGENYEQIIKTYYTDIEIGEYEYQR